MDKSQALQQQIEQAQQQQQELLSTIQRCLGDAAHGPPAPTGHVRASVAAVEAQIAALTLATHARAYVAQLRGAAERVKQLERQIRPAASSAGHEQPQDAEQLVGLAFAAAQEYGACLAELDGLASASFPEQAVPQQLRGMEEQLKQRLQGAHDKLRAALGRHIHSCLAQCGWPPPLVPSQPGPDGAQPDSGQLFSPAHADAANMLQRLMLALTKLQLASEQDAIAAAQLAGASPSASDPEPPLLWMAQELAAPLCGQLLQVFGPSAPGSPGALDNPDLVLGTVHRLALENVPHVDFLQGVVQALELHGVYHVGVEFTRALRDAVKQLLRTAKLPEVAAAASRDLWLAWIDALIAFEGSLARSGLLGCYWDGGEAGGDLPVLLLRGSTLTVLGDDPAWMDAWLDAEASAAASQVESVLYSEAGWAPGQLLLAEEGRPAWQVDLWPPRAAEEVVSLVESLLRRLRFIPQPQAQQRYLEGCVAAVLGQAHSRIVRLLQQADVFKHITSFAWLPRVCMCICFCHFVEQQLQEMLDDAQVMMTRVLEDQQDQQLQDQQQQLKQQPGGQQPQQHGAAAAALQQQQPALPHPEAAANGNHRSDWGDLLPGAAAASNGQAHAAAADAGSHAQAPQPHQAQVAPAATAKLRMLAAPIADFSACRREWVLKLGKAAAMGFTQHAAGYVSRGALFKADDSLPALAADGQLWSSGVVSGELQPALAWLAQLLDAMSTHLDRHCFRQAWGAAAAAINRELFNSVACEAVFSDAGALQLLVDLQALLGVFGRYTPRPGTHFRELNDAAKLLNLQQQQAEFVRQAVSAASRAPNACEVLKSVGVYHLDPDLADTVMSLRK